MTDFLAKAGDYLPILLQGVVLTLVITVFSVLLTS